MITAKKFRTMCLSLADASEAPHFDRAAFRTPQRIFATMAPDEKSANLMLDVDQQAAITKASNAFAALDNGWGRKGATQVVFATVDEPALRDALEWAHARAMVKAKAKTKTKAKATPKPKRK
jgi:hypothetical protein